MESCGSCGWDAGMDAPLFGGLCPQCNGVLSRSPNRKEKEKEMKNRAPLEEEFDPEPLKWAGWCAACGGVIWAGQTFCSDCGWSESGWED